MTYFERLYGFPETNPQIVYDNLSCEDGRITSRVNGRAYHYGELEIIGLAQLRNRASEGNARHCITIEQIVADVGRLHQAPTNVGAFFQAASQFNLLEMVHADVSPRAGISGYEDDRTQGPVCAIACAAGTTYRNYFAPVGKQTGQCGPQQIDCLASVGAYLGNTNNQLWEMRNGYALFTERSLRATDALLQRLSEQELHTLRGRLQIGLQWATEVTTAGRGHRVTQAYCSALPVGYHPFLNDPAWERICRLVLDATYEATLLAAAENYRKTGNNRCYLTLVGGGVFANRLSWILAAIERAVHLAAHLPLEILVVSYGQSHPAITGLTERLVRELK